MNIIKKIKIFLRESIEIIFPQTSWLPRYYTLFKWVRFNKEDMVLDAGCGEGFVLLKLASLCRRVIALDISTQKIASAKDKIDRIKFKQKVNLFLGDILHLPFSDNSFEQIIFLDALSEIEQDRTALAELARILKPSGRLIISAASNYTCCAALFKEQKVLRKIIPKFLYQIYLPGGKSWLDAEDEVKKELRIFNNYTLADLDKKTKPFLEITRFTYILKKYGSLATDITYGIKGLFYIRFIFLWFAVRLDYYFGKDMPGYAVFVEFIKKNENFNP